MVKKKLLTFIFLILHDCQGRYCLSILMQIFPIPQCHPLLHTNVEISFKMLPELFPYFDNT